MKIILVLQSLLFSLTVSFASNIDSLIVELKNAELNKKVYYFNEISKVLEPVNPELAITLSQENIKLSIILGDSKGEGESYWNLANAYETIGNYDAALKGYEKGKSIGWSISDTNLVASCINNIGIIYSNQGQYDNALDYYMEALKIREKKGVKSDLAISYNNIGNINFYKGNLEEAMNFYMLAVKTRYEIKDSIGVQSTLNNIGNIKYYQGLLDEALDYYHQALVIRLKINDKAGVGSVYNNIATMHEELGETEKAIEFYELSYKLKKEVGNIRGLASTVTSYAGLYYNIDNYEKAIKLYREALDYSVQINDKSNLVYCYGGLSLCYGASNQIDSALYYADLAIPIAVEIDALGDLKYAYKCKSEAFRKSNKFEEALELHLIHDSLSNEMLSSENMETVSELEAQFENEKKELEIENLKGKERINEIELIKEKNTKYAFAIGLLLALVTLFLAIWGYVVKRKSNKIINEQKNKVELQKEMLEEKNREITDSIIYAKRIQAAILPHDKLVKEYLQDSFVLYKPKDIVAGDFYWMEHRENKVLFAAADCTGHGVPGAMVSVVCNNGLNRSVREDGLTDPGAILNRTREIIIEEFNKSEEIVKDGMDIALCSLEGMKLKYAGANNPLWIIRDGEIIEIKANKQPIGRFEKPIPFDTHSVELIKGDTVYIFSDGYVDQFGGPKGKKFMYKPFRELLKSIQKNAMSEQREIIENEFEKWRGEIEQVDDICVIGVRIA